MQEWGILKVIDEQIKDSILRNIGLGGAASEDTGVVKQIVAKSEHLNSILNLSSGTPRIHKQFKLILSQPQQLEALNPFEIRCCLCGRVISYPAWYLLIRYAINHIHYFVCFDKDSRNRVTAKCYRRG